MQICIECLLPPLPYTPPSCIKYSHVNISCRLFLSMNGKLLVDGLLSAFVLQKVFTKYSDVRLHLRIRIFSKELLILFHTVTAALTLLCLLDCIIFGSCGSFSDCN